MSIKPCPPEDWEQREVVKWLRARNIPHFATVNQQQMSGGNRRAAAIIVGKLKALGMHPGVSDLCVLLPHVLLFIEMKREHGGVVSKVQKEWINMVNELPYAEGIVCRGHREAIKVLEQHTWG